MAAASVEAINCRRVTEGMREKSGRELGIMLDIRGVGNAWNVYTYSMISARKVEILHEHQDDAF